MPVEILEVGAQMATERGASVVCIPVYGALDLFSECLLSALTHTPDEVPILVCDDATPDQRLRGLMEGFGEWPHTVHYLRQEQNVGFVENVNAAMATTAPADVVVLNSDCVVTEGWLEGLRAAAHSEARVATATALTNAGTIVSVPYRNQPTPRLPDGMTPDRAAARIRERSLRLWPDLPTCIGHCMYIRRSAIELVGPFDTHFSPGYEEEVDFSQRCILHGLRHLLADDVFVVHRHMGSFGTSDEVTRRRVQHHAEIAHRYPYYDGWCQATARDERSPLARALSVASRALRPTSVSIDGRCLTHSWTGTQLVTLGVIAALDAYTDLALRVLVPPDLGEVAGGYLNTRSHIDQITLEDMEAGAPPSDVVHRPYQVSSYQDVTVLRDLGRRVVLTQLDNIAFRNPAYFDGFKEWRDYQRLNRVALAGADRVVFISRHGATEAQAMGLVEAQQATVVEPDTDTDHATPAPAPRPVPEAGRLSKRPFLLCLGTDFLHKNRVFAIKLLDVLRREHEFDGVLVFAGPKVTGGSSAGEEARYLLSRPDLAERIIDVGAVGEAEKQWLLEQACAVLYPTTYEGFGLTPFEAAGVGTPCVFAAHTSLAEVLPESAALIVPWDPEETARKMAPVLVIGKARTELVRSVKLAGARFTSRRNARRLADVYEQALIAPARETFWADGVKLEQELVDSRAEVARLEGIVLDPLNRDLVGPDAVLPSELRRAVLAVANRPSLRRMATAVYRAGYLVRHPAHVRRRAREGKR